MQIHVPRNTAVRDYCIFINECVLCCAAGTSDQESTTGSEQSADAASGSRSALLSAINGFNKTSLRQMKSGDGADPPQNVGS